MVDGKLLHRIVVWPTYEDAAAAKEEAASDDCKLTNKLTVWDTYEQAAAHTSVGGGGYIASAVHFDGLTFLHIDALAGVVNGPKGIFSYWAKNFYSNRNDSSSGATALSNSDGNYITLGGTHLSFPDASVGGYLTDQTYSHNFDWDVDERILSPDIWYHVLMAWDVGFAPGTRRLAMYVNDALQIYTINTDNGDETFEAYYAASTDFGSSFPYFEAVKGDCADVYINYVDTIVEADNTISEANRRKFITAGGKPANPSGFPANGTVIFSGDKDSFAGNSMGSGGAFDVYQMFICDEVGASGPGPVSCPGLRIGDVVVKIFRSGSPRDLTASFESIVTVDDQIQQTSSDDYTSDSSIKVTVIGTLTNASTSPSD